MAMHTIEPFVTATAVFNGGRNGHAETTDHSVAVDLSVRKEMGGPELANTTTRSTRSPPATPPASAVWSNSLRIGTKGTSLEQR